MLYTQTRVAVISRIAASFLVVLTILSFVTRHAAWSWPLELLSHFQVQYWFAGLLAFAVLLALKQVKLLPLALACFVALSSPILPWFIPTWGGSGQTIPIKVMFLNLNIQNNDTVSLLRIIEREQPDVVALAEVTPEWNDLPNAILGILPYQAGQTAPTPVGIKVFSRYRIHSPKILSFDNSRTSLALRLDVNGTPLNLVTVHPVPGINPSLFQKRNRQLDGIATDVMTRPTPLVVIGDFNTTPWSPYYQRFIQKTGLKNTRRGFGILPTWPAASPISVIPTGLHWLFSIPIDHCLVSPSLKVKEMRTGPNARSDHRSIIVTLAMTPEA